MELVSIDDRFGTSAPKAMLKVVYHEYTQRTEMLVNKTAATSNSNNNSKKGANGTSFHR